MKKRNRVLLMVENVALARDHRLRKHATALLDAGYHVTIICPRHPGNHQAVPNARILDYPPPKDGTTKLAFLREYLYSLTMAALLTLRAYLTNGFDTIQISSTPDIYFLITAPYRLLGKHIIFDLKDLSPEMYEARYHHNNDLMHHTLRQLEKASLHTAHHVLVVNQSLHNIAHQRGGIPATALTIVGNGPRLDHTTTPRTEHPELRRGHQHLAILIGMMGPQDSIHLAIHAIDHLINNIGRTDTAFTFVGTGDAVTPNQQLVKDLGLDPWITFPGWADQDQVFDYLTTADLGLEPNLEPFVSPVKAMEYMAFGLPFVAFDLTETRTLAHHAALYAPPGDTTTYAQHLHHLLNNPTQRKTMGDIGKERVKTSLAWDHQKERYLGVYQELTDSAPARRPATSH